MLATIYMLMMRLQRVGRKNDPSFRIVVTDKRNGPKSDKHIDRLGSYNPKMNHVQLDAEKAKEWLAKGVQPSDTLHNILVSQKVIESKKKNVLPKKSPIIDHEAIKKAEEEAAAKLVAEAKAKEVSEEQSESDNSEDTQSEAEAVVEEVPEETEAPAEVVEAETAETPAEEAPEEVATETEAEPEPEKDK